MKRYKQMLTGNASPSLNLCFHGYDGCQLRSSTKQVHDLVGRVTFKRVLYASWLRLFLARSFCILVSAAVGRSSSRCVAQVASGSIGAKDTCN
jgi:hypothetical protein